MPGYRYEVEFRQFLSYYSSKLIYILPQLSNNIAMAVNKNSYHFIIFFIIFLEESL